MKPKRIQRKRTKGFKLPPNTICVSRPSKWGNPFKVDKRFDIWGQFVTQKMSRYHYSHKIKDLQDSLFRYTDYLQRMIKFGHLDISELKGKNLACWCPIDKPCHADILLKLIAEKTKGVKQ